MKRTAITRKTALRRTRFKRGPKKARPTDDPVHLALLRSMPCCVPDCRSKTRVQAHHSTVGRGLSRKSPDREAFPLCWYHHRCFHDAADFFDGWTKERRREFQRELSQHYRQLADFPVTLLVRMVTRWGVYGAYATDDEAQKVWERVIRPAPAWWGPREEAVKLLADPTYVPERSESA